MTLHQVLHCAFYGYSIIYMIRTIMFMATYKQEKVDNLMEYAKKAIQDASMGKTTNMKKMIGDNIHNVGTDNQSATSKTIEGIVNWVWIIAGIFTYLKIYFILLLLNDVVPAIYLVFQGKESKRLMFVKNALSVIIPAIILYKAFSPLFIV